MTHYGDLYYSMRKDEDDKQRLQRIEYLKELVEKLSHNQAIMVEKILTNINDYEVLFKFLKK